MASRSNPAPQVAVRSRTRAIQVDAATEAERKKTLDTALQEVATTNFQKNLFTRTEKKAKEVLEAEMVKQNVKVHDCMVSLPDGSSIPYQAEIAPGKQNVIDVRGMAKLCGVKLDGKKEDVDRFVSMLSSTQEKIKEGLGANALTKVVSSVPTEPALSTGKKKG